MARPVPAAFSKRPHAGGCSGDICRTGETTTVDRIGRRRNGGWVVHIYECNRKRWTDCPALVLVTETAVRNLAVSVDRRAGA